MDSFILTQISNFMDCVYGGLAFGIVYDIYRVIRGVSRPGKIMTIIGDIIFWLIASIFLFLIIFYTNYADIRFYIFIGIIIGVFIYIKLFSYFVIKFLYLLIKFFKLIFAFVYKVITTPFKFLYRLTITLIKYIKKITQKILNIIKHKKK